MPKTSYYAVKKGKVPGIYLTWAECEEQIKGFSGAIYKKFATLQEAEAFAGLTSPLSVSAAPIVDASPSKIIAPTPPSPTKARYKAVPYDLEQRKQGDLKDESGWNVVFTDGACQGNGQVGSRAGIGVWWDDGDVRNLSERCPGDQTNNRAELIAIIRCLETDLAPNEPLIIKTDSSYSISCIRDWLPRWIQKGWKNSQGKPVKNQAVIQHLAKLLDSRTGKVRLQYVRGHAGVRGNEGADRLAVAGCQLPQLSERHWSSEIQPITTKAAAGTLLEGVEIDADFELLSNEELERMEREQIFD